MTLITVNVLPSIDYTSLKQRFVPVKIRLGIVCGCLCANQIGFCLAEAGLRDVLLGFGFSKLALGRCEACQVAGNNDFKVARVQFDQQIASLDLIIILEMHRFDMRRNFWADLNDMRFNGCVIGNFITGVVDVPENSAGNDQQPEGKKNHEPPPRALWLSTFCDRTCAPVFCGRLIAIGGFEINGWTNS
jgi:hypothetical protein